MRELRYNTAARVTVGPFIDKGDGITPEITLTVTSCHLTFIIDTAGVPTLIINSAATASGGDNDMVHITADIAGYYDLEFTEVQTNYYGRASLSINDVATHLPVFHEFMIITQEEYDHKYGTGELSANIKSVNDMAVSDINDFKADISGLALETGGNLANVLDDTNELQSLISSNKLPAQIKGIDDIDFSATMKSTLTTDKNSVITEVNANETKIDIVDNIADAIKVVTDKLATIDGLSPEIALRKILNYCAGEIETIADSDSYTYKRQDKTTAEMIHTIAGTKRTIS